MKATRLALLALAAVALIAVAWAGEEQKAWFDLENCAMCKNLKAEEGLLENIQWETHLISNGVMSIAAVPGEYEEAFERARENMNAAVMKMQSGEQVHLCGFCTSYGRLMMAGAKSEEIIAQAGHISLTTSNDPEVVKMIQEHGQRTIDEYNKMMAEQAEN